MKMPLHLFVCGGADIPDRSDDVSIHRLDIQGRDRNIDLKVEALSKSLMDNIPDSVMDLLEVAVYVYCADQEVSRGVDRLSHMGKSWYRRMEFIIPVRNPGLWNAPEMIEALEQTLGFMSDDVYSFRFVKAHTPVRIRQGYFDFHDDDIRPGKIALFSGGLDSLAGAIESMMAGERLLLIGHHSADVIKNLQHKLVDELKKNFPRQFEFVSLTARNTGTRRSEHTQRTRSFLFAALAAGIALMEGKNAFSFFENGIVSFNLPMNGSVLGARAARTTHPKSIHGLQNVIFLALEVGIEIAHPYLWKTKKEVVEIIAREGFAHLITMTNSCTRVFGRTIRHPHCGVCSQCLDRRFAIMAAGLAAHEDASSYATELFRGARSSKRDMEMALGYVRLARDFASLTPGKLLQVYPEVEAATAAIDGMSADDVIVAIHSLYARHSEAVRKVLEDALAKHRGDIVDGNLPPTSLLSMFFAREVAEQAEGKDYDTQLREFMDKLSRPTIRFFVDEANDKIVFKGHELKRRGYEFVMALIRNFREGKSTGEEIECVSTNDLLDRLRFEDEVGLRKLISRIRKEVNEFLAVEHGVVDGDDAFIENVHGQGYRLNRRLVEVMSRSDLGS